jgi:anti-sigma B factor antagonist
MDLDIAERQDDAGRAVLVVTGSIDLESRERLLEAGHAALRRDGCHGVVLDLEGVQFVDSTGVGAFVELAAEAEDHGATFEIRNPSARVQRLLEVTGLADAWAEQTDQSEQTEQTG